MEKQEKLFLIFRRMSKIASIISILVGVLVLIGWAFDIAILKSILPQFVTMKANTALAFVLIGLSLFFLQGEDNIKLWKINVAKTTSVLAFLIGFVTLGEIIFNWDAGIDQLFFKETVGTIFNSDQGRMAPATAFNFSLLGLGLIFLSLNRLNKLVQYLSIITLIPALLTIIGCLYGVKQLISIIPFFSLMAIHTAITFFIFSLGSLFARPKLKPIILMSGDDIGGIVARRLIPIVIITASLFGYVQLFWHNYVDKEMSLEEASSFGFVTAIVTSFLIVSLSMIVWWISVMLHKLDSNRKDIAEKLAIKEERYSLAVSKNVLVLYDYNLITGNISWEGAAKELFGLSEEEVSSVNGDGWINLIHPEDKKRVLEEFDLAIKNKTNYSMDYRFRRKDGSYFYVRDAGSILTDQNGKAYRAFGLMSDITDRKKIEDEVRTERNEVYALLQSIGDAVIVIDRNWNIILWNDAAHQLSGWLKDEVIGKPFRNFIKLIRERDRGEDIRFIEDAMVSGVKQSLKDNTFLIKKDGKEVVVSDSAAPIISESGDVIGVIIIIRDFTLEKESSHMRSSFTYASHQLLTPITKALWSLEVILKEDDAGKIKSQIASIYQTLKSVRRLSEEIVIVSEIDQAMIVPKIKEIKLASLFDDIVKEVSEKANDREAGIIISPLSVSSSMKTDQRLLSRALAEILDNAIIYSSKKSKIKIDIKIEKDSVLIEIQNSGIGISAEHQPLIFTKFFRGSNFNTTDIMGAGLGLYIAKAYIELLHGKIWFRSEENKETTFYVSIPL